MGKRNGEKIGWIGGRLGALGLQRLESLGPQLVERLLGIAHADTPGHRWPQDLERLGARSKKLDPASHLCG